MSNHDQAVILVQQVYSGRKMHLSEDEAQLVSKLLLDFIKGDEELRTLPELFYLRRLFLNHEYPSKQLDEKLKPVLDFAIAYHLVNMQSLFEVLKNHKVFTQHEILVKSYEKIKQAAELVEKKGQHFHVEFYHGLRTFGKRGFSSGSVYELIQQLLSTSPTPPTQRLK